MYLPNLLAKLKSYCFSLFCAGVVIALASCSGSDRKELLSGLSQDAANEVELTLLNNGIKGVDKERSKEGTYSILVDRSKVANALGILNNFGLPAVNYTSMGEVFKKDSFISTPLEEHGRFIYALEQEIASMISQINGVTDVNVVVNIPQPSDNLWQGDQAKSSASVLVSYQQGSRLDLYSNRIKSLVCNAVPGLAPDNVEVVMIPQKIQ
jgi:type III secretion protein J